MNCKCLDKKLGQIEPKTLVSYVESLGMQLEHRRGLDKFFSYYSVIDSAPVYITIPKEKRYVDYIRRISECVQSLRTFLEISQNREICNCAIIDELLSIQSVE